MTPIQDPTQTHIDAAARRITEKLKSLHDPHPETADPHNHSITPPPMREHAHSVKEHATDCSALCHGEK